jgi:diadenosine tetraphosphate (Ap4A) HIT family hydrolase
LETHFEPVKLNLWTAGNGLPHLHTHVIPRFLDDPAPEGPLATRMRYRSRSRKRL